MTLCVDATGKFVGEKRFVWANCKNCPTITIKAGGKYSGFTLKSWGQDIKAEIQETKEGSYLEVDVQGDKEKFSVRRKPAA